MTSMPSRWPADAPLIAIRLRLISRVEPFCGSRKKVQTQVAGLRPVGEDALGLEYFDAHPGTSLRRPQDVAHLELLPLRDDRVRAVHA